MDGQPVRVRDLPPGYTEWPAPAALRHALACLWAQVIPAGGGERTGLVVLPDACTDLIWEQDRGAFVAGPDTGPVPTVLTGGSVLVGVRFRTPAGGPALGVPLSELRDQRVDLADLRPSEARRLPGTLDPDTAAARVADLAAALVADGGPDPAAARAAALLADPRARAEDVAAEVGLSMRQLRRRCHAVGRLRAQDPAAGAALPPVRVPDRRRPARRPGPARPGRSRGAGRLRRPGAPDPRMPGPGRPDPGRAGQAAGPGPGEPGSRVKVRGSGAGQARLSQTMAASWPIVSMPYCSLGLPVLSTAIR